MARLASDGYTKVLLRDRKFIPALIKAGKAQSKPDAASVASFHNATDVRGPLLKSICRVVRYIVRGIAKIFHLHPASDKHGFLGKPYLFLYRLFHYPATNFTILMLALAGFLGLIISIGLFFINDVILFHPPVYSNKQGTFVIEQPFNRTYYMYLFNPAERWSNTGIQINKGDNVKITASGGYFANIHEQTQCARNNTLPRTGLISFRKGDRGTVMETEPFLENPDAPFGAILYEIGPEVVQREDSVPARADAKAIGQVSTDEFTATRGGILRLSVNDITLTYNTIRDMLESPGATRLRDMLLAKSIYADSSDVVKSSVPPEYIHALYSDYPTAWYDDNNGELLFSIRVDRAHKGIYQSIFGQIDLLFSDGIMAVSPFTKVLLSLMIIMALDFFVGWIIRLRKIDDTEMDADPAA